MRPITSITPELVSEYISQAAIVASSENERQAVQAARELNNWKASFRREGSLSKSVPEGTGEVRIWTRLILKELQKALCARTVRYKKQVAALKENGRLLIGAIAGYVAATVGVSVAVIAALVAALLQLALIMGIAAFCEQMKVKLSTQTRIS